MAVVAENRSCIYYVRVRFEFPSCKISCDGHSVMTATVRYTAHF